MAIFLPWTVFADGVGSMNKTYIWPLEVNGWKMSEVPANYDPKTVFSYMNGAAELFLAYNMKKLDVARYEKADRPAITVEIYQMGSPEDAYGIFSFQRDDPEAGIGQGSEFGGGLLRFWKGNYLVTIFGEDVGEDVLAATVRLGKQIASTIKKTGRPPKILSYLPNGAAPYTKQKAWFLRSHILLNQRFFIAQKNLLNLTNDREAALALYGTGKDRIHFLLIKYPTQVLADRALSDFRRAYMPEATSQKSAVKTENNRWTIAEKSGLFIMIVFDALDEAFARNLFGVVTAKLPQEGK
jgi:hypothetical protein